jgi:hypothetical protein
MIEALAAAAESQGMPCESWAGVYERNGGSGFTLGCEGPNPAAHAKFGLAVTYWTLDGVSDIHLSVWPDATGTVVSRGAPIPLFSGISGLAAGRPAMTWVQSHLDDPACAATCTRTFGTARLLLTVGANGGRQLEIYGYEN